MRKFVSVFVLLFAVVISLVAQSYQSAQTTAYIERYHKVAIREMYLYKIPASITLAQGILESGSGRSDLAIRANNHFGIKCPGDYSGKGYYKDDDKRNECFRVYKNADGTYSTKYSILDENHISMTDMGSGDATMYDYELNGDEYVQYGIYTGTAAHLGHSNAVYFKRK